MDFQLTDVQRELQERARKFAIREIKPISREREAIPDPRERFPWDVVEKGSRLGFRTLAAPIEHGGGGGDTLTEALMNEELAAGDLGVATIFDQTSRLSRLLFRFCTPEQRDRHLVSFIENHRALLAIGGTEPAAGSDTWLPHDAPGAGVQMFARRTGDSYVLNGTKSYISLGPEASLYIILARTDREKPIAEGALSAFLVPRDTPGFRIGTIHDKIGQRLINNADLILEEVRIPAEDRLLEEGEYYSALARFQRGSAAEASALALGVGRVAYEAAVAYARERVQGGRPIIDQQAVGLMLADMAARIETSRLLIHKAAWAADHQEPFDFRLPGMAKFYVTEAVFEVCRMAMEVHGALGIMKDLPVEKYLRDASTMLHSDGTNQVHRLRVLRWIKQGL